ncbi:hypothetical protein Tco_0045820 [Tanacetum coccineum]
MVACLEKSDENAEFHHIVDFLSTCSINYSLTVVVPGGRSNKPCGDTIAQTRIENVSKLSNDSLLARGIPLKSDKDKYLNLMIEFEKEGQEIYKERIQELISCKDLTNVGLEWLVVRTSGDEEDLDALNGEEVFVAGQNENVIEEIVDAAQLKGTVFQEPGESMTTKSTPNSFLSTQSQGQDRRKTCKKDSLEKEKEANIALTKEWDDIQAKIEANHELAQRLQHFAAKSAEEKRNKPPTQAQQRKITCTYLKNMEGKKLRDLKNKSFDSIQKMFNIAFKRVNTFVDFITDLVGRLFQKEQEKTDTTEKSKKPKKEG